MTLTPVIGTPQREYTDVFVPGEEALAEGELRVTVLGSGNPWPTRAQASASVLIEIGNRERDILVFDLGTGSLANYASLKLPVNKLNKVFLSHLHADHMGDLLTLSGSFSKVGRADGPVSVWGPSGTEPRLGTRHFVEALEEALAWDTAAGYGAINPDSMKILAYESDFSKTQVVYEANGVKVTSFPVVHCISGAVGYRLDFAGLSIGFSGDTRPCWPLVHACKGVDVLIHECFPPAAGLAAASGLSIERATIALNAAHTSPRAVGKVFGLVKPRLGGLWHTLLSSQVVSMLFAELGEVYDGPVVQTQDLTVINITKDCVVARQAKVSEQLPPIPGEQRAAFQPVAVKPPDWWAQALIPLDQRAATEIEASDAQSKARAMIEPPAKTASETFSQASSDAASPSPLPDSPRVDDSHGRLEAARGRMEGVLVNALGLRERPTESGDIDTSTRLALDRTYLAIERTLQAWIRTTLSMISFGFTLGKLAEVLQDVEVKGPFLTRTFSITGIAYFLVVLGTLALLVATVQHALAVRELRSRGLGGRISIASIVARLLVVIGGFAFTALVLRL